MGKAVADEQAPADELEDEPVALEDPPEDEPDESGADEAESEGGETDEASTNDNGEVQVTIGDPPEASDDDPASAPAWVGDLRKSNRQKDQRIRDLERQLESTKPAQPAGPGPKPKLEDFDFDEAKYSAATDAWYERKHESEAADRKRAEAEKEAKAAWDKRLNDVNSAAAALQVSGREQAQEAFEDQLTVVQQGIVMYGPDDPKTSAMLRHALGANPSKLRELAAIDNPVKFAFAVADLVPKLKVTPKKSAPPPERVVNGSGRVGANSSEKHLEALRAKAQRTGDYTEVVAYKRKLEAAERGT